MLVARQRAHVFLANRAQQSDAPEVARRGDEAQERLALAVGQCEQLLHLVDDDRHERLLLAGPEDSLHDLRLEGLGGGLQGAVLVATSGGREQRLEPLAQLGVGGAHAGPHEVLERGGELAERPARIARGLEDEMLHRIATTLDLAQHAGLQ